MIDLIVFKVGNNSYALNIENIHRIIQVVELTEIPNAHEFIDGMMSYENNIIKVLNFRKLIGLPSHEDENVNAEDSSLKLLFYEKDGSSFAIKVDSIEDIAHIEESDIMHSEDEHSKNEYLDLEGVLDLNGVLINVIKTVHIPN